MWTGAGGHGGRGGAAFRSESGVSMAGSAIYGRVWKFLGVEFGLEEPKTSWLFYLA